LYGTFYTTTQEWNYGLFTNILCKIINNFRGDDANPHWIILIAIFILNERKTIAGVVFVPFSLMNFKKVQIFFF
ncbi:hypothetical protein PPACK8108_LOCUS24624, partial [Phakopsora pachyrhizi]